MLELQRSKAKHLFGLVFLLLSFQSVAQDYNYAVGLRMGLISGGTYRHFFDDENSIQAIFSFQNSGLQITATRQYYQPILLDITDQVFFFYGIGGHLGYSKWGYEDIVSGGEIYRQKELTIGVGLDGHIGIEYRFMQFPITLGLGYKPFYEINLSSNSGAYFRSYLQDVALALQYTF